MSVKPQADVKEETLDLIKVQVGTLQFLAEKDNDGDLFGFMPFSHDNKLSMKSVGQYLVDKKLGKLKTMDFGTNDNSYTEGLDANELAIVGITLDVFKRAQAQALNQLHCDVFGKMLGEF